VLSRIDTGDYPAFAAATAEEANLFRYRHNDPIDLTDPMGTVSEARQEPPWYTHSQQAEALDRLAATRELVGLSSTYIRASLSAMQGQMERNLSMGQIEKGQKDGRPSASKYAPGEPYKAVRTPTDYGTFEKNGKLVNLTDWRIQVFDKNGRLAGVSVSETKIEHLAQKDVATSQERQLWTERTDRYGYVRNPDHWQQSFTSRGGFDTIRQTLLSGGNTLQWTATQSPGGVDVYTHQTGYFEQPGN